MAPRDAYALGPRTLALRAKVGISGKDPETRTGWIDIAGPGEWKGHPNGPFTLDVDKFASCIAAFDAQANPIVVDYDHASLAVNADGGAPAAGWVQKLEMRGERLWGLVEWCADAAQAIRLGKFRYCSGVFVFDEPDRQSGRDTVCAIDSVALTNRPFLDGQTPIALTRRSLEKPMPEDMPPPAQTEDAAAMLAARLMEATGLDAAGLLAALDANLAAIVAALKGEAAPEMEIEVAPAAAPAATPPPAPAAVAPASVTLSADPTVAALQATVAALQATVNQQNADLAPLRAQAAERAATALDAEVDQAIACGKIHPAQRAHYVNLARNHTAAWRVLSAEIKPGATPVGPGTAPQVVPPSQAHTLDKESKRRELTASVTRMSRGVLNEKQIAETVERQLAQAYPEN